MPPSSPHCIPLLPFGSAPERATARRREPVTIGVPLGRGVVTDVRQLGLDSPEGTPRPLQARPLDRWSDGSLRWVLLDFQANIGTTGPESYVLRTDRTAEAEVVDPIKIETTGEGVQVTAAGMVLTIERGGSFPLSSASFASTPVFDARESGLRVEHAGAITHWQVTDVSVLDPGPVRAELLVRAAPTGSSAPVPLEVSARVEVFSGTPAVRIALTLRNPRRAVHEGGQWPLGDPGSFLMTSATVAFRLQSPIGTLRYTVDSDAPLEAASAPLTILQASSGGSHWDSRSHVNRDGHVTLPFKGYRVSSPEGDRAGDRAQPTIVADTGTGSVAATMPQFWQHFPRAMSFEPDTVTLGLFPSGAGDAHELQGGEQKTHRFVLAFGPDSVTEAPLAWCHAPLRLSPSPEYIRGTGAIPYSMPGGAAALPAYLALVDTCLEHERGFFAKREAADEFGWRHFGDLPADHESAFQPADQPFVSHYNNQYDAIAGFAAHFLRTGDVRWWELMDDLARHVSDIDIYRTTEDKAAYNGGLFWHTNHYVDADTSTHRTYPRGKPGGGGPSAEHNYNHGLMLHYFLTGDRQSRDAAIGLGQWVIDMDDGGRTPFRWLSRNETGLATETAGHQGPGRGAGHSILACLVAHRLTGDHRYLLRAEALIRRCAHPNEPVSMIYVENIEGYWSYTAFLQALGSYLEHKIELGETDDAFCYARACLLAFARWMAAHERPYLERREKLQYPTETWVAQDFRKADVFLWAARHATGDERRDFIEQSRVYLLYVVGELPGMHGYWFTRPLVLAMTQGLRAAELAASGTLPPAVDAGDAIVVFPARARFKPQRGVAMFRAAVLAGAGLVALLGIVAWLLA